MPWKAPLQPWTDQQEAINVPESVLHIRDASVALSSTSTNCCADGRLAGSAPQPEDIKRSMAAGTSRLMGGLCAAGVAARERKQGQQGSDHQCQLSALPSTNTQRRGVLLRVALTGGR